MSDLVQSGQQIGLQELADVGAKHSFTTCCEKSQGDMAHDSKGHMQHTMIPTTGDGQASTFVSVSSATRPVA